MSLPVYVSRVVHTLTAASLFSVLMGPYIFAEAHLDIPHQYIIGGTVVLFGTGIFNAIKLKPKETMGEKAGPWRKIVYFGKGACLLGMTPLTNRVVGAELAPAVKLGFASLAFAMGAYARFYREANSKSA